MAEIDFEAVLKERFLQKNDPGYKPDACEAALIESCVAHATWVSEAEIRAVLGVLYKIISSMTDKGGVVDSMMSIVVSLTEEVMRLQDSKP